MSTVLKPSLGNIMRNLCLLLTAGTLAACSSPDSDLQQWMADARSQQKARIKPPAPPAPAEKAVYTPPVASGPDSFDPARLKMGMKDPNGPDMNRPKEVLEGFSLEQLAYVGSLTANNSRPSAFVTADGHTYTVGIGNYIGQNFGRITAVLPDRLVITELFEDADGKWKNREATLPLSSQGGTDSKND